MTVTQTSTTDPCARVTFTWSDDCQDCDVLALGVSDETLDAMLSARAHEGADFPGFTTDLSL